MRVLALACLAGLFLAPSVHSNGQIVKVGGAYRLRAKYIKGKALAYGVATAVTQLGDRAGATKRTITLPILLKVLDVRGGVAKIQNNIGPWKESGKPIQKASQVVVHVDSRNRIVNGPAMEVPNFSVQFPEKPLKVGQSWSTDVNTSGATPIALQVKATYTLRKIAAGRAMVEVTYSGSGVAPSRAKTSGRGTMELSVADGSLVSMRVTQTVALQNGLGATTVVTVRRS